jgi:hypothetical protein
LGTFAGLVVSVADSDVGVVRIEPRSAEMSETTYEAGAGRAAYQELKPLFDAYGQHELATRSCNAERSALHVLGVAKTIESNGLTSQFAAIGVFDMQHLHRLRPLAWATWYCATCLSSATAVDSRQRVCKETLGRARARRRRMLRLLKHHLGHDGVMARQLADIRRGTGYLDLAADLARLVGLYEKHEPLLSRDPTHYDPSDLSGAREDVRAVIAELAATHPDRVAHWRDQLDRAFTALLEAYNQVRHAAFYVQSSDREFRVRFGSLHTASRRPRRAKVRQGGESAGEQHDTAGESESLTDS